MNLFLKPVAAANIFLQIVISASPFLLIFIFPATTEALSAPTKIQEVQTTFTSSAGATFKTTASFDVLAGDVLVAYTLSANYNSGSADADDPTTISGGSLSWNNEETVQVNNQAWVAIWTATVDTNKSMTVTFTDLDGDDGASGQYFGGGVMTFRGGNGVGFSNNNQQGSGGPTVNITTTSENSAIVVVDGDWDAGDGTSRAWRVEAGTLDESLYFRDAAQYTAYGGYHPNAGVVGTYAVGLTTPSQRYSIAAVEVLGGTPATASTLSKPPNNLGLVGYWSFNDGNGTQATDFSGRGKHGTLTTTGSGIPAWIGGKRGSALDFDGTDEYVSVGSVGTARTISFWMKADDTTSRKIIDIDGTDQIELDGISQVTATSFPGTTAIYVDGSTASPVVDTNWHHITITDTTGVSGSVFEIGRVSGGYFDGTLDEVRVYSRVLSPVEISALARTGAARIGASSSDLHRGSTLENGLVGHWPFDGSNTGQEISDRSGQVKHGFFIGGATSSAKVIGRLGQGLNFDGVDDYVDIGNAGTIQTVAFWLKADDTTSREVIQLVSGAEQIELNGSSQVTATGFSGATVYVDGSTDSAVVDSNWRHVVVTNSTGISATAFQIGQAGGSFLDGSLDDVRIYNRALTATEASNLYNLGRVIVR